MWALVPLKSPASAKSRLRPVLSDVQRRELFFIMAGQVLGTLVGAPGIDKLIVVTPSREVGRFARKLGAEVLLQAQECGTAQALIDALEQLRPLDSDRLLMMSGDLPLISRESLLPLMAAASAPHSVAIVPDRGGSGTNALLCAPPNVMPICFGPDSFQRHMSAARDCGIQPSVIESEALCLDIDVPEDLDVLSRRLQDQPDEAHTSLRQLLSRRTPPSLPSSVHGASACTA